MIGNVLEAVAIIDRVLFGSAEVVPEYLFVEVTEKMERLNANVGALQSALQKRPEVFESVGMHLPVNVAFRVVNHIVSVVTDKPFVGLQSVSEKRGHGGNVLSDFPLNHVLTSIRNDLCADFSATLKHTHDDSLVVRAALHNPATMHVRVHVASLAADESFVHFHFRPATAEFHKGLGLHRQSDAMEHEPRRLLSDAESAMQFVGTDAVLAVGNHPNSDKPLVERKRRIFKDSPDLCRELPLGMLALAFPDVASGQEADFLTSASRAFDTVRPAPLNHEADAVIGIGEVNDGLL